jgi:thiamine monophosphate synthase
VAVVSAIVAADDPAAAARELKQVINEARKA